MINSIRTFFNTWSNPLLIIVGASALIIYWFQERRKISEAASLIILQVDDLQDKLRKIHTYIADNQLNETAFYESQIIFAENYWSKYKHYFVKKIDAKSLNIFDNFYNCASEILEQQQLMKNLQKNSFFVTQSILAQMESFYIQQGLQNCIENPVNMDKFIQGIESTIPPNLDSAQKTAIENMLKQFGTSYPNVNFVSFWNSYNQNRLNVKTVINQRGLTSYIPEQIRISLEKAMREYISIHIFDCKGYKKMSKIAERKF